MSVGGWHKGIKDISNNRKKKKIRTRSPFVILLANQSAVFCACCIFFYATRQSINRKVLNHHLSSVWSVSTCEESRITWQHLIISVIHRGYSWELSHNTKSQINNFSQLKQNPENSWAWSQQKSEKKPVLMTLFILGSWGEQSLLCPWGVWETSWCGRWTTCSLCCRLGASRSLFGQHWLNVAEQRGEKLGHSLIAWRREECQIITVCVCVCVC